MIQEKLYKFYILYHVLNIIFISKNYHFILYVITRQYFNITICKNFIRLQRSIGKKKTGAITNLKKSLKKQPHHKNKFGRLRM